MKRIAVIGFYGHNNAGDDRILYCLQKYFHSHYIWPINGFKGLRENLEQINRCDLVIFGGGGLIQRGRGVHASLFSRLRPRLVCVGISVEAVHQDNIQLIEVLKEKAEFILVRDAGSRKAFGPAPHVLEGPDLTFIEPLDVVQSPANDRCCGINLLDWGFWRAEYQGRFDRLMRRFSRKIPLLEMAYPLAKWDARQVVKTLRASFHSLEPLSLYNEPTRNTDAAILSRFFPQTQEKFSVSRMAACSMVVSMRLHGLIFASQMGIPFLSLSYQPKNEEFCRAVGLEKYSLDLFDTRPLGRLISDIKKNYQGIREQLLEYRMQSQASIRKIMDELFSEI